MTDQQPKPEPTDVPQTIFNLFIEELRKTETPTAIIDELKKVIIDGDAVTETALKNALTKNPEI